MEWFLNGEPSVSLGIGGSPESIDSAIRIEGSTHLRQQLVIQKLENRLLRRQLAVQQQQIEQLETRLKRYENPNTPPSKQGGGAGSPGNDDSDEEENEDQGDDIGGDADAASDSSPGRDEGHEGITRPPPEPEETIRVDQGYCPDCE